jgi:hypothetical protein
MLSTGRYIAYNDAINKWSNNHLELAMNAFRKNNNLDIVICHDDRDDFSYKHFIHKKNVLYKTGLFTEECVLENSINNFNVYFTDINTVQ